MVVELYENNTTKESRWDIGEIKPKKRENEKRHDNELVHGKCRSIDVVVKKIEKEYDIREKSIRKTKGLEKTKKLEKIVREKVKREKVVKKAER